MIQTGLITSAHSDLLTCLAYDYYGANIASCGLDQKIVVTAVNAEQSPTVKYEWRAHSAPITCVAWAHPEFGEVLASAGMDRTVRVWERGEEKAVLLDARAGVRQVEFAPQAFGLKVATVAADGWVRVYECLDLGKLDVWALADAVEVAREEQQGGAGGKEVEGGWGVSWCKERYWGQVVAAVAGASDVVKIIQFSPSRSPQTILELKPPPPSTTTTSAPTTSVITTVAWAPSCGRSYHLIATGGRDGHVRIWKVSGPMVDSEEDDAEDRDLGDATNGKWSGQLVADFDDHARIGALEGGVVGKVEWNVTGTILSSSGSDGRVRLWKASLTSGGRIWRIAGSVGVEQKE